MGQQTASATEDLTIRELSAELQRLKLEREAQEDEVCGSATNLHRGSSYENGQGESPVSFREDLDTKGLEETPCQYSVSLDASAESKSVLLSGAGGKGAEGDRKCLRKSMEISRAWGEAGAEVCHGKLAHAADLLPWQGQLVDIFAKLDEDSSGTLSTDELRS